MIKQSRRHGSTFVFFFFFKRWDVQKMHPNCMSVTWAHLILLHLRYHSRVYLYHITYTQDFQAENSSHKNVQSHLILGSSDTISWKLQSLNCIKQLPWLKSKLSNIISYIYFFKWLNLRITNQGVRMISWVDILPNPRARFLTKIPNKNSCDWGFWDMILAFPNPLFLNKNLWIPAYEKS